MTTQEADSPIPADQEPTNRPPGFTIILGRIGSSEQIELTELDYVTTPEGNISLSGAMIEKVAGNLDRDTVILLRQEPQTASDDDNHEVVELFADGRLSIDHARLEVSIDGAVIPLTHKEYRLLDYFTRNKGTVLSREAIYVTIWGDNLFRETATSKVLDVVIRKLRQKLGFLAPAIHTKRSAGYMYDDSEEAMATNIKFLPTEKHHR